MPQLTLGAADNKQSFVIEPGQTIVLHLAENPTTGFRWEIDRLDDEVLALQDSDYLSQAEGIAGRGGTRIFTFAAQKEGQTNLELKLWRQWEGDKSVRSRFSVTLQIQNSRD